MLNFIDKLSIDAIKSKVERDDEGFDVHVIVYDTQSPEPFELSNKALSDLLKKIISYHTSFDNNVSLTHIRIFDTEGELLGGFDVPHYNQNAIMPTVTPSMQSVLRGGVPAEPDLAEMDVDALATTTEAETVAPNTGNSLAEGARGVFTRAPDTMRALSGRRGVAITPVVISENCDGKRLVPVGAAGSDESPRSPLAPVSPNSRPS